MRNLKLFIVFLSFSCTMISEAASCNALKMALEAKWAQSLICAKLQKNKSLIKAIKWIKYRNPEGDYNFEEITRFIYQNPHFPDIHRIIKNAENKIDITTSSSQLKKWFNRHRPTTPNGFKNYIRIVSKNNKQFPYFVRKAWIRGRFSSEEKDIFYKKYQRHLSRQDHYLKADHLLWSGGKKIDNDILGLLDTEKKSLIKARVALLNNHSNMAKIISSIPKKYRKNEGLLYAQALWYKKRGYNHKLAKLLVDNEGVQRLKSDNWSKIRLILSSDLLGEGDYKLAYRIINNHDFKNVINYVDAEWVAGKIAYLYLKNYKKSFYHFQNLLKKSKFSVSRSKGAYWLARTSYRLGDTSKATEYYKLAASYPETFYGQLAAMKINKNKSITNISLPQISQDDINWANNNELVQVSKLLIQNNKHVYARKFITVAVIRAPTRAKRYLVSKVGYNLNRRSLSVVAGKELARRGMFEKKYSYPLKDPKLNLKLEIALINSVIRQESEFDQYAQSHAGAYGLMQLIYPTAKYVAKRLKRSIQREYLLINSKLNILFGSYYLSELIDKYKGSYVLALAAYNAGPSNVDKWIALYGDPRKTKDYDAVVGWIEKIPYYETRGYVQNILSNLQIYRSLVRNRGSTTIKIALDKDLIRQSSKKLLA